MRKLLIFFAAIIITISFTCTAVLAENRLVNSGSYYLEGISNVYYPSDPAKKIVEIYTTSFYPDRYTTFNSEQLCQVGDIYKDGSFETRISSIDWDISSLSDTAEIGVSGFDTQISVDTFHYGKYNGAEISFYTSEEHP